MYFGSLLQISAVYLVFNVPHRPKIQKEIHRKSNLVRLGRSIYAASRMLEINQDNDTIIAMIVEKIKHFRHLMWTGIMLYEFLGIFRINKAFWVATKLGKLS